MACWDGSHLQWLWKRFMKIVLEYFQCQILTHEDVCVASQLVIFKLKCQIKTSESVTKVSLIWSQCGFEYDAVLNVDRRVTAGGSSESALMDTSPNTLFKTDLRDSEFVSFQWFGLFSLYLYFHHLLCQTQTSQECVHHFWLFILIVFHTLSCSTWCSGGPAEEFSAEQNCNFWFFMYFSLMTPTMFT